MGTHYDGTAIEKQALDTYIKLTRASESVSSSINGHLHADGLTLSQFGVLEALYHVGPMTVGELGEKILRSSGNMTLVVDNLVKRGLIHRQRCPDDRRRVNVTISDDGRKLIAAIWPAHLSGIVDAFSALSTAEQAQLASLCRKLGLSQSDSRVTHTATLPTDTVG